MTPDDTRPLLDLALHGLEVLHSPHFGWGCTPQNCAGQKAIEAIRTCYRRLFCEAGATMAVRIAALRAEFAAIEEVHELCDSLQASAAGVHGRALETKRTDDKRSVPAMWQPNIRPEGASAKP
jgi:hypothetical protein